MAQRSCSIIGWHIYAMPNPATRPSPTRCRGPIRRVLPARVIGEASHRGLSVSRLEMATNILTIITCVSAVILVLDYRLSPRPIAPEAAEKQLIGKQVHLDSGVWQRERH